MAFLGFDPGDPNKWYQSPHLGLIPAGYGGEIASNCSYYSVVGASYQTATNFTHPTSHPPPHHFTQPNHYPPPQHNYYAPPPPNFTQPHACPPPQHNHSATLINGHLLPLRFPCASSQTQAQYDPPSLPQTPNHLFYPNSQPPQQLPTTMVLAYLTPEPTPQNTPSPVINTPPFISTNTNTTATTTIYQPNFIPTTKSVPPLSTVEQPRPVADLKHVSIVGSGHPSFTPGPMDQLKGSGKLPSAQQGSGKDHVNAKMCELRESLKRSTDTFISEFKEELQLLLDSWQSPARRVDDPQKFVSPPSSTPELISATTGSLISVNDGSQVDMSLKFGSLQPSSVNLIAAIADDSVVRNSISTGLNLLQHEVRFNTGISTDPVASDISNSHDISDETVGLMNDISAVVSKSSCEDDISVGMTEELNHVSNSRRVSIGNREFGIQSTEGVISGDGTEFDDSKVVISGAHLAPVEKGIEKTVQALVAELEINSRSVKDYNDVEAVKTIVARNGKQIGMMSVIAPLSGALVAESRVAAHMSIRDKGGGLAQQLIEFTSGVNSEEEDEGSTVQLCVREYTKKVEELSRPLRTPGNAYTEVYSSNNLEFRTVKSQYCWDELCLMSGNCGITCNNDCVAVLEGLEYKSCDGDHEKAAKYAPSCHQECGEFQLKFESLNEVSRCCTYETSLKVIQLVPIIKKAPHVIIERHKVPFDVGDKYELECLICCCLLLCDCKEEVSTHVGLLKLDGYIFCLPLEDKFENVSLFIADKLEKTGEKRLLKNAATVMFVSKDTLYVALRTVNGDICVVEMKQMEHELAAGIKKKELYVNSEIVPEKIWENWKLKSYAEMASEEKISLFLDEKYDKMEGSAGMMYNYIWEKWKSVVMAAYKYHTKGLHVGDHIIEMSNTGGNIHVPKFDSFASHFGITTFFASALQQYGHEIRVESLSAYFPSNRYDTSTSIITVAQAVGSVLCWKCGILMAPNAAGRCFKCLQCEVDFAKGLQKQVTIMHCLECDIYLQPRRTWIKTPIESNELLAFCVKRLKNLSKFSNTGDIFRPVVKNQISILGVKEWMITSGSSRDDKLACKWLLEFLVSGMIFLLCM